MDGSGAIGLDAFGFFDRIFFDPSSRRDGTSRARRAFRGMRTILLMLTYSAAAGALMFGMAGAVNWLIAPDPTLAAPARAAAPVPRRIADSIERKNAPLPEPDKAASVMRPVMQEAPVALTQPAPQLKIREPSSPPSRKTTKRKPRNEPMISASQDAPARPHPTARTDFPY